jgi:CTD kinase subunit alpha
MEGDWHEFESKALRKEARRVEAQAQSQKDREKRKAEASSDRDPKRARATSDEAGPPR